MIPYKKSMSWIVIVTFFVSLFAGTGALYPKVASAYDAPPKDQGHTGPNPDGSDPTGPQNDPSQSEGGDPVQLKTGNFTFDQEDLFLLGRGMPSLLKRFYNSHDIYDGPFGFGWNHNFNITTIEVASGDVILRDGDGIRYHFTLNQDGTYNSPTARYLQLVKIGASTFRLYLKDRTEYYFNNNRIVTISDPNGNQTSFEYAADGKIVKVTNPSGRWIQFGYGSNQKISSATDNIGRTVTYQYDQNNNLISVTNALGYATTFSYDGNHRLTIVRDAKGNLRIQNTYDSQGKVGQQFSSGGTFYYVYYDGYTRVRDRKGNYIYHYFNSDGNPTRDIDELGRSTYQTWDADMHLTSVTDANGRITRYTYDGAENLSTVTDALNNVTHFTYDSTFSNLATVTDTLGRITSYSYDANGNLIQKTDALGNITTYEYNTNGQPIRTTDEAGRNILLNYDSEGNLVSVTDHEGNVTRFEYDVAGRRTKLIDPLGNATTNTYDALDHLVRKVGPMGETVTYSYDEVGNLFQVTDPNGNTINYTYDTYDHLISTTDSLGNSTAFQYDINENLTATTDALGRRSVLAYDKANRLVRMTRVDGSNIDFVYDAIGNNTSITDPSGNQISFAYDALNRLVMTDYADGSYETRTYDAVSNITGFTDRSGKTISLQYDGCDRITLSRYPNSGDISQSYNVLGFVQSVTNSVGTINYTYNALDRLSQVSDVYGWTLSYTYDTAGRRVAMADSLGGSSSYAYDASGRLITLTSVSGQTTYAYDAAGRLIHGQLPNGVKSQYAYDAANRLASIQHRTPDDSVIDSFTYEYDAVGNKVKVTAANDDFIEYEYNTLYRLIRETSKNASGSVLAENEYGYDANNNRISLEQNTVQTSYSYNSFNQLVSDDTTNYVYDGNGNLVQSTEGTDVTTYTYDDLNHLKSVTFPDVTSLSMEYDGLDRRVQKTGPTGTIRYLLDQRSVIAETDASDAINIRYQRGNGLVSQTSAAESLYYLFDGQGSTRYLTNAGGGVAARYAYDAFGNLTHQTGSAHNPFTFVGNYGYYQDANRLFHIGARYYRADIGRFLQVDPLYQGTNWYVYALSDPVNLVDPTGEWVHILIGGGIGGAISTSIYLISTPRSQWSWGGGLRAAAVGTVVGGVGAATFGASMPATLGGAVLRGGAAGLTTTLAGDLTNSAFDQKLHFSSPYTYGTNIAVGGLIAGGTYGVGKAIQNYRAGNTPGGAKTWNEFQKMTKGKFSSRAEAGKAWAAYRDANGIATGTVRSGAQKSAFLKQLADGGKSPKYMNQWLKQGKVPPGYQVDHIKPLSIGGKDVPANMRLQGTDLHTTHHKYYRPWQ